MAAPVFLGLKFSLNCAILVLMKRDSRIIALVSCESELVFCNIDELLLSFILTKAKQKESVQPLRIDTLFSFLSCLAFKPSRLRALHDVIAWSSTFRNIVRYYHFVDLMTGSKISDFVDYKIEPRKVHVKS